MFKTKLSTCRIQINISKSFFQFAFHARLRRISLNLENMKSKLLRKLPLDPI